MTLDDTPNGQWVQCYDTGTPCLSHSFLPFGQVWLELDHPLLRKYPERRIKHPTGRLKQDDAGRYFFSLKGLSSGECPLGWLDWLAGQPWLYEGEFRKRLFAYLRHDCIQRELDDLFPDPDDDSRKPVFSTQVRGPSARPNPPSRGAGARGRQ